MSDLHDSIHTLVSRPGPAEARVVDSLGARFRSERRVSGGVMLRTLETREPVPTRGKATLLLLHGRGHSGAMWSAVLSRLEPDRAIVAPDLPGFGRSGIGRVDTRSMRSALATFVDPIEALARDLGPLVVVGHSLGGLVAVELALRSRAEVRGLVLVAPMGLGPYVTPSARAYLRIGPERIAKVTGLVGRSPQGLGGGRGDEALLALRRELAARGARPEAKRAFDLMVPLVGEAISMRAHLEEIAAPTLLVWAERDQAFPLATGRDAVTRLRRGALEVIPTGHSPHVEAPDLVAGAITRFVAANLQHFDGGPEGRSAHRHDERGT